jgi:hypothetical protein
LIAGAVKLALDKSRMPNEWIDLLTDDPAARERWRLAELRKEL